ncbi:hypothetical protein JDS99_27070 [Bacillus cereus group sp. N6]|uniref:hypothetical protein n=1 Tax=Bacillus cereus group sp. N6 TaxID=2794583 RepID=UPI0018F50693|nr:hypothetical protein [Bacillus cereus group sp. N6]MBJ8113239.1 hypothetical protein [Bacillus cereus group sp. N6]
MRGNKKEEQIQKIILMQEEIRLWIQYVFQQWESKKQEQHNSFPKLTYIETVAFESSESYQEIKSLSVGMVRDMKPYKREKLLLRITELHQHMQSIVAAVLETIQKYYVS